MKEVMKSKPHVEETANDVAKTEVVRKEVPDTGPVVENTTEGTTVRSTDVKVEPAMPALDYKDVLGAWCGR